MHFWRSARVDLHCNRRPFGAHLLRPSQVVPTPGVHADPLRPGRLSGRGSWRRRARGAVEQERSPEK
eukprot:9376950-Heterocapsa_arctica.AAC.1